MPNTFHGEYRTVESCQKVWMSEGQDNLSFPPQVNYNCDLCKTTHNFRLNKTYTIATPGQAKQFDAYCSRYDLERDVSITK